jgi:hypothetical protein
MGLEAVPSRPINECGTASGSGNTVDRKAPERRHIAYSKIKDSGRNLGAK